MFVIEGNLNKNTVGWQATSGPIQATQGLLSINSDFNTV